MASSFSSLFNLFVPFDSFIYSYILWEALEKGSIWQIHFVSNEAIYVGQILVYVAKHIIEASPVPFVVQKCPLR